MQYNYIDIPPHSAPKEIITLLRLILSGENNIVEKQLNKDFLKNEIVDVTL